MNTETYEKTNAARDELFNSLGAVDSDVITHIINPALMGGPRWPSLRQAYRTIRTKDSIMLASDGLSDPFDDIEEPNNGFRLEIIAETKEEIKGDISKSWLFKLVDAISQQAASNGEFFELISDYNVITMELFAKQNGLEEFQDENGKVGIMIGVESPRFPKYIQFPAEEIILATVQMLMPDELKYVSEERAEGRNYIHKLLNQSGLYHYVTPRRDSLLKHNINNKISWWKLWKKS